MRKNIYVSEKDLPVFERAEALADGDSISSVIAAALQKWIEAREATEDGMSRFVLQPGTWPADGVPELSSPIGFMGRQLATWTRSRSVLTGEAGEAEGSIYQTKGGRYVVELKDCQWISGRGVSEADEGAEIGEDTERVVVNVDIYDSLDDIPCTDDFDPAEEDMDVYDDMDFATSAPQTAIVSAKAKLGRAEVRWIE